MASSSIFLATLLLLALVVFAASEASTATGLNCGEACTIRCSKSSRPNLCKRACNTCCARCSCVPKGTNGYDQSCPCYAALTTHGGVRKCP